MSRRAASFVDYDTVYAKRPEGDLLESLDRESLRESGGLAGYEGYITTGDLSRFRASIRALDPGLQLPVVDLGCGRGELTHWLASKSGRAAVGIDTSAVAVRGAAARCGPNTHFLRGDAHRIPMRSDSASAAVSLDALYLVARPREALKELRRVLVASGLLIFTAYLSRDSTKGGGCADAEFWPAELAATGFELLSSFDMTGAWCRHMLRKHSRRWAQRERILAQRGESAVAELAVSAAMIGAAGRPRFLDDVERREFTAIAV
jgi:ubiquinone/menaquinone biosynthesis C-methylase UbiE